MPRRHRSPSRSDPYRRFTLRIQWDGHAIPGITFLSPLLRSTEATEYREGGSGGVVHSVPGRTTWAPIVLRRPVSTDHAFEQWANQVSSPAPAPGPAGFRKNIRVEILTGSGHVAVAYDVYRCWVSAYEALPTLDVDARERPVETLTLQHEGWQRDPSIPAPP
jgi:phage tail-like protein